MPLVNDAQSRRFMSALPQKQHTARETLIGVLFAGEREAESGVTDISAAVSC